MTKAPTIITRPPWRDTPALCCLRVLTTISLCLLLLGGIFLSRIPFDVFVMIVLQRSVTRLLLSEVRNHGENRQVAITGRIYVMTHAMRWSSSQSRPVINFHWRIVHSRFHDLKCYVFWIGYFCTPARSLNTPRCLLLLEAWTPPGVDHSCTTGNRSRSLCYDSWSPSHLGYLHPGTTPVIIKLDHDRSCPWV